MKAMFVFILGLLITFGGVGGVETSLNTLMLLGSFLICLGGLLVMFVGVIMLKAKDAKQVDNPVLW